MTPSQPFDLAAMRADRDAGTPGVWIADGNGGHSEYKICTGPYVIARMYWGNYRNECDAHRIARVPAMEAEIERLTALVDRMVHHMEAIKAYQMRGFDAMAFNVTRLALSEQQEPPMRNPQATP